MEKSTRLSDRQTQVMSVGARAWFGCLMGEIKSDGIDAAEAEPVNKEN